MTTPSDTGDALRTLARLGQEFDAGDVLPSIEEGGVKPTPELRRLVRLAIEHDRTLSPVSLDEVADTLASIIELCENGEWSNARDEAQAMLTRIKERQ